MVNQLIQSPFGRTAKASTRSDRLATVRITYQQSLLLPTAAIDDLFSSSFEPSKDYKVFKTTKETQKERDRDMEFADCEEISSSYYSSSSYSSSSSSSSSYLLCLCRICHEEEEQGTTSMESPCACSGTLKFAHRGCIQRWCDEKRSTICEICLEKFEPGYTVTAPSPAKPRMTEVVITIRGSLEAARLNNELQNPTMVVVTDNRQELEHAECSPASYHGKPCFQSVALMFAIMFMLRHIIAVTLFGSDHYSSKLSFVFLLRALGVLLPFYLMIQLIAIIRNVKRYQQLQERDGDSEDAIVEQQNVI